MACNPVNLWLLTVRTNCRMAPRSFQILRPPLPVHQILHPAILREPIPNRLLLRAFPQLPLLQALLLRSMTEAPSHESLPAVHFAACSHHPADVGCPARRLCRLSPVASVRASPGRLSHHSNPDLLSR